MEIEDIVGPANKMPYCCGLPMNVAKLLGSGGMVEAWHCRACNNMKKHELVEPGVGGEVTIQLIHAKTGKVVHEVQDNNVFTDVGRNYLAALVSYHLLTESPGVEEPTTSKRRADGIRYMMVGKGTQNETNAVAQLNDPVAFNLSGHYLAQVVAPNELPGTGISAVFQRIFGANEISMPAAVNVSEVGLFFSGPTGAPLALGDSFAAPIAYKTFPAIPKTSTFLFSVRWEIKF